MPASQRRDQAAQAVVAGIVSNNIMMGQLDLQAENDNDPATVEERIAIKAYEIADFMEALA